MRSLAGVRLKESSCCSVFLTAAAVEGSIVAEGARGVRAVMRLDEKQRSSAKRRYRRARTPQCFCSVMFLIVAVSGAIRKPAFALDCSAKAKAAFPAGAVLARVRCAV